jgi:uncharacterized repeat protein (TIGR03847 family)
MEWVLDPCDFVTLGTHGVPGQRLFLFQAGASGLIVTMKIEKHQAIALARALATALEGLGRPGTLPEDVELVEPAEPAFRVGEVELLLDAGDEGLVIVAMEDERDRPDPSVAQLHLTREQAARLAIRIAEVVEQGRPTCPLCGYPIDPGGHACPRTNGHHAPAL